MKLLWNALIARRRSLVATIALGAALLAVGGCSTASLYFHNQGYEDTTSDVKKQVDALDVAGAFKTLNENATDLAKQEDAAIVASTVALRDERLAQLIDPIPGDGDAVKGEAATASRRLRMFVTADATALAELPDQMNDSLYRTGAETFRQLEKAVQNEEPGADAAREKFLNDIQGAPGAIKLAAANYLTAMREKKAAAEEAKEVQAKIDAILKEMRGTDPASLHDALKDAIAGLEKAGAAAQLAGLTELENFLKCGLIVDLEGVAADLEEDQAVKATPVDNKEPMDKKDATASVTKAPSEAEKEAAKSAVCPTETPKSTDDAAPVTDKEAEQQKIWNAALSTVITVVSEVKDTGLAANRLKRIDANIVALSNLRQRLGNAKAAVTYNAARLPLFRGYLYAILDQYRLLREAADANVALLSAPDVGFTTMRGGARKRNAALALSSYASAWNYGKIPAVAIDFRFKQARRKYELEVAASSAANYKAVVQPIADALAQYGKGGITPDTIALIISQIGIFSALL